MKYSNARLIIIKKHYQVTWLKLKSKPKSPKVLSPCNYLLMVSGDLIINTTI